METYQNQNPQSLRAMWICFRGRIPGFTHEQLAHYAHDLGLTIVPWDEIDERIPGILIANKSIKIPKGRRFVIAIIENSLWSPETTMRDMKTMLQTARDVPSMAAAAEAIMEEAAEEAVATRAAAPKRPKAGRGGRAPPVYTLTRSPRDGKKWMITTPSGERVHFGQAGASDYTIHKDPLRMVRYVQRHAKIYGPTTKLGRRLADHDTPLSPADERLLETAEGRRENWSASGLNTAGFWSRYLLWLTPDIRDARAWIEQTFNIKIE
jgi:hypothetical protein